MTSPAFKRCLALPVELAARGFTLRGETLDDVPFLERLYVSVRWEELAPVAWPEEAKVAFLQSQFALQYRHYAVHYAESDFGILEHQGVPAGRLYLFRGRRDVRIVDVSLLPEWRNGGIGSALLGALFEEAAAEGRSVSIHVEKFNPAQRLYHRLGFREISEDGVYRLMEWKAEAAA
ncbi:MAG: GNAT family N-acetyltransferase [Rhodospirillales bacterium]|nr:GNAT family N-acetyltransferase [Rhodospirillales bacterium]